MFLRIRGLGYIARAGDFRFFIEIFNRWECAYFNEFFAKGIKGLFFSEVNNTIG
jgi:hypothetical protein